MLPFLLSQEICCRYGIPENILSSSRSSSFRLIYSLTRQQVQLALKYKSLDDFYGALVFQGFMHDLKLEGRIMYKYNLQRSDLMYVAIRFPSIGRNLGLLIIAVNE